MGNTRKTKNIQLENKYLSVLEEEQEKYYLTQEHDKIFRTVLSKKKDVAKFVNKILKTKYKEEDLERYETSYINKKFQNREADIVYKIKEENTYLLIEHQTKIDYSMPYRIAEYQMEIMKSAIKQKKIKQKTYKIPIVVPIVLYTGKQKWNANRNLERKLEGTDIKVQIGYYELVENNTKTEEELLKSETFIEKMMLIEKAKNTEDIVKKLEKIIEKTKEEDKETLKNIIAIIFEEKIGTEKTDELIKKIENGGKEMSAVIDMIRKENQMYINIGKREGKIQGKKEGKKEGIIEIAKKLLKRNTSKEEIAEITGLKINEIEKLE